MTLKMPSPTAPRIVAAALALLAWVAAVGTGFAAAWQYNAEPGDASSPPPAWPAASALARADDRPQLVVFLHPKCGCSVATLHELQHALAGMTPLPAVAFVIAHPLHADASWQDTPVIALARRTGFGPLAFDDGTEARHFGARTSGEVLAYDAAGILRYAGGITAARGHEGDNMGRRNLLAALAGGQPQGTPRVYGCALWSTADIAARSPATAATAAR